MPALAPLVLGVPQRLKEAVELVCLPMNVGDDVVIHLARQTAFLT